MGVHILDPLSGAFLICFFPAGPLCGPYDGPRIFFSALFFHRLSVRGLAFARELGSPRPAPLLSIIAVRAEGLRVIMAPKLCRGATAVEHLEAAADANAAALAANRADVLRQSLAGRKPWNPEALQP